ncbi:MAG: hypothetical protein WB626_04040 [Bacteroidota bacterium]
MRALLAAGLLFGAVDAAPGTEAWVRSVSGDVQVRRGVAEEWSDVRAGDTLGADATLRTGTGSGAVIAARREGAGPVLSLPLPAETMLDVSDLRRLSPEELMLKLAMERVRSSPYEWNQEELRVPRSTVVHGPDRLSGPALAAEDARVGWMLLNGARALFAGGFYSTCALRTLEVLRRYPSLGSDFGARYLAAEALERADLLREAVAEYLQAARLESATDQERSRAGARVRYLKKSLGD